eukprot:CAMPEP_0197597896 /NCGR_PEP_ID=MMETSP1326-20131121/28229_1 /TAXON_ID=1155430 /ORGANISM="Genus nov. species nov., Strain RCC2288" /LENGTH=130 /DNA_ID=CAMNT_0043164627 /DNA_START=44 /DNA_END=434 /DNA_ORIENTATION=+
MSKNTTGKVVVSLFVLSVTAAFGATAVYPLFINRQPQQAAPVRVPPVPSPDGGGGGFKRKGMWGTADQAIKANNADNNKKERSGGNRATTTPKRGGRGDGEGEGDGDGDRLGLGQVQGDGGNPEVVGAGG